MMNSGCCQGDQKRADIILIKLSLDLKYKKIPHWQKYEIEGTAKKTSIIMVD
jgi:hypothetical protein